MSLAREAVQARLSTFLGTEVRQALEPLVRREHYAVDLQVILNPISPDEDSRLSNLGDSPRDADLVGFIQQVRVKVTLDERVKKPASTLVRDTVSAAVDPLRARTGDDVQIAYADLSSLKGALAMTRKRTVTQPMSAKPPTTEKPAVAPAPPPPVLTAPSVLTAPAIPPPATITELQFNAVYPSVALVLAAALLAFAVFGAAGRVSRKLEHAFGPLAEALAQVLRLPEVVAQSMETLRSMLAEHRSQLATAPAVPVAQPQSVPQYMAAAANGGPIQIAIVSAPPQSPALAMVAGGMGPPPAAKAPSETGVGRARVRPISSYSLEKQLNAKRKTLFQSAAAVARVLLQRFPVGSPAEQEAILSSFLKSLAPKETEALSRHLSADDLLRFSRLASSTAERASVNALISFVEEIAPQVTTQAGLSVPIARAVELLEKFDPEHLSATVKECPLEVAGIILRSIPPETREEVFARFDGQAREDLLKHIAQPAPADPAAKIPAIAESAVRVCLRAGLKDLLLLWLSEARSLLPRERYDALLLSIREEASGLIADPRR